MLTLVGTDGEHYYTFELETGKHVIGRRPECDIFDSQQDGIPEARRDRD